MIRLLTAFLLFASLNVVAEVTLTNINNNEVADAEEVMGNFNALKQGVEANTAAIDALPAPPSTCETDQIIKWNGTAWACATAPLADLSCAPDEALVYRNGKVDCSCDYPGTPITDSNFGAAVTDWLSNGNASEYGDITKWCTRSVTDMSRAFQDAGSFDADISGWDTRNVTTMERMFAGAETFNQDIGGWDVGLVTNMVGMFASARAFNQDIGNWKVGNVTDMFDMFNNANAFGQDIGNWDVSSVTDMGHMFWNADSFNQDIGSWNVSAVQKMNYMFIYNDSFNQDIGNWDVSNVSYMSYMFYDAISFNQDLSSWDATSVLYCTRFHDASTAPSTAWTAAYGGSIAGKTPPLSASLIAAGCGN